MKENKYTIFLLFTITGVFIYEYSCLQNGLKTENFSKLDVKLEVLSSGMNVVPVELNWISSSLKCAIVCSHTKWCSGYLVCKNLSKCLCAFLKVTENITEQTYEKYDSCFIFMPPDFQMNLPTTTVSTTLSPSSTTEKASATANTTVSSAVTSYYRDCKEAYKTNRKDGIYYIKPDGYPQPFKAKCRNHLFKKQIFIQQNSFEICHNTSFNQSWAAYSDGFGDLEYFKCSFWLGNKKLVALTAEGQYKLKIYAYRDGSKIYDKDTYLQFIMRNESFNFEMVYSSHKSNWFGLDDGFHSENRFNPFYTYDHDSVGNCASVQGSGWWFDKSCVRLSLNVDQNPQWYKDGKLKTYKYSYMVLEDSS